MKKYIDVFKQTVQEFMGDKAPRLGAALAYYTIFSMAPLLVLVIAIAGLVFGRAAAQGEIVTQITSLVGPAPAQLIQDMIARASGPKAGTLATLMSLTAMALGASGVFGQLQHAFNQIWEAPPPRGGFRGQLRRRAATFGMILGVGFLLLVSLVLSAALAAVHDLLARHLPLASRILPALNFLLSFGVVTALFAMIYKVLPDVDMSWRDVWLGASVTALLFTIGKTLLALYLGRAGVASVYGAAGSFVLVLLWIYYSAQIMFIGAEFTEVYSRRYGSRRAQESPS